MNHVCSKKRIVIVIAMAYIIISIFVLFFYLIPHFQEVKEDEWYIPYLEQFVADYFQDYYSYDGDIQIRKFVYTGYDPAVAEQNRNTEDKQYPFMSVSITVRIKTDEHWGEYLVSIIRTPDGKLNVEDCVFQGNRIDIVFWD